jgi:hypothetical protein
VAIISNAVTIADAGAFSASLGAMTLIKTLTASSSSTLSFVHGSSSVVLDSTYPIYKFEFIGIHPQTNEVDFSFNLSVDTGSNYNVSKTSTNFASFHDEGDGDAGVGYESSLDLANGTGEQFIYHNTGSDNDQAASGELFLFNPSSTTFVKHFISTSNDPQHSNVTSNHFVGGYANTTSAIDAIRFKFDSGNIDAGIIKLYGIKDS